MPADVVDFKNNDEITFQAWINPDTLHDGSFVFSKNSTFDVIFVLTQFICFEIITANFNNSSSNELLRNNNFMEFIKENKISYYDGKWLFKNLTEKIIDYIMDLKNERLDYQEITVVTDHIDKTIVYFIEMFLQNGEKEDLYRAYMQASKRGAMFDSRCFNIPKEETRSKLPSGFHIASNSEIREPLIHFLILIGFRPSVMRTIRINCYTYLLRSILFYTLHRHISDHL